MKRRNRKHLRAYIVFKHGLLDKICKILAQTKRDHSGAKEMSNFRENLIGSPGCRFGTSKTFYMGPNGL